jgi:hypothetical protein
MAIWAAALPQRMSAKLQNTSPAAPRRYMPGAPEIYFHKSIDNSRLVRSVDPARKREMRVFTAAVVMCFLMALVYLCQHCSSIEYGYKIEDLRLKRDQMVDVNRTLRTRSGSANSRKTRWEWRCPRLGRCSGWTKRVGAIAALQ